MSDSQGARQSAEGGPIAQALGPGSTASVSVINRAHVRPVEPDPAALEAAERLLSGLPLDRVPKPERIPAGSRRPPIPRNRLLVGRDEDLKALASRIKADEDGPPTVVVSGIGGVGKTQLANEFAHRYGRFFAGGVYWLNLSDPASIPEEVAACGGTEGMDLRHDFHDLPLETRIGAVMNEWHGDLPRLIVLDDCPDGPTLAGVRPTSGGCRVLVTSRGPISDPALGIGAFGLEPLGREASVRLLRGYHDGVGDEKLGEIADELGNLPLALDLAGRYLRRYRHDDTDADRYLGELKSDEVLGHRSLLEPDRREVSPTEHDMNVARTFAVSYRRLDGGDATDRLAIGLLARAARFAPGEPIGRRLLLSTLGPMEDLTARQREEREDALGRLVELGLVGESESGPVSMHKLVAAFARSEVEDEGAQADVEWAVGTEAVEVAKSGRPVRLEPLMPHLRQAVDTIGDRDDEPAYVVRFGMGCALGELGRPAEAVPYLRSAVEHNAARLRTETNLTARERDDLVWLIMRQRNDLGTALDGAGDPDGALAIHEPLLEERRNILPQPHEDVASTLTNIGFIKAERGGPLHEVGPLYDEALDIREAVLAQKDDEDPERRQLLRDVAESHGNQGALSMDLGRPSQAAQSYRRALDIYEDLEETEDKHYAKATMSHGAALGLLGDFEAARDDLERALRIHRRVLPEGSARTTRNLLLLGTLLAGEAVRDGTPADGRGREILDAAMENLGTVLDLQERSPGRDVPLTAGVMGVTAKVAEALGRHADASSLRGISGAIRRDVFRITGPAVLAKWAEFFAGRGLHGEAELYWRRSLDLLRFAAPWGSREIADTEFALGRFLQLLGRHQEAERHLKEALTLREAILGEDDPATELVGDCLAYLRREERDRRRG